MLKDSNFSSSKVKSVYLRLGNSSELPYDGFEKIEQGCEVAFFGGKPPYIITKTMMVNTI